MSAPKIIGIMACDPREVIGKDNKLPWRYTKELEFFTKTVSGHVIIMGRNTFQHLPKSILDNSFSIVFSRTLKYSKSGNVIFLDSLKEFKKILLSAAEETCYYLIGGSKIASTFLEAGLVDQFLLTRIKKCYEGDTFFPIELLQNFTPTILLEDKDFVIYEYSKK